MSRLARILEVKQREVAALRSHGGHTASPARSPHDVVRCLARPEGAPLRLIAEIKRKSPSAGELSKALDAPARALRYAASGARMVSVLCDGPFFGGSYDDLEGARRALDEAGLAVPLLAKEFVLDPVQLALAARRGADAALLIVRILGEGELGPILRAARDAGLEPFVEITDERELERALGAGARVVGVNARDLDTLQIDTARAARVLAAIPRGVVAVHLSGLGRAADIAGVASGRADAALVGEALMRQDNPGPLLQDFVRAAGSR